MKMAVGRRQYHVLAVDDTLTDRKLIERILKTSSFHVTVVDSGSKALEFLESKAKEEDDFLVSESKPPVNMIITDYSMPEMTGYELLVKIKRSESLKDIPVVIMSSENIPARIERCIEEGAEEFLLKPMRLSHLDKIKPLFDLNPTLSQFLRDSKEITVS